MRAKVATLRKQLGMTVRRQSEQQVKFNVLREELVCLPPPSCEPCRHCLRSGVHFFLSVHDASVPSGDQFRFGAAFAPQAHERTLRTAAVSQCGRMQSELQEVRAQLQERLAVLQAAPNTVLPFQDDTNDGDTAPPHGEVERHHQISHKSGNIGGAATDPAKLINKARSTVLASH